MLKGLPISPGYALGSAYCLKHVQFDQVPSRTLGEGEIDHELIRFQAALDLSRSEIKQLLELPQIKSSLEIANIFQAHLTLLDDPDLIKEVSKRIGIKRLNLESILTSVIKDYSEFFRKLPDPQFQGKAIDIMDVGKRIIKNCQQQTHRESLGEMNHGMVIIAEDLTPSEIVGFDPQKILGIATSEGTATSHASILARSLGIPALIQVKDLFTHVSHGLKVVIDGTIGIIHPNPSEDIIREYNAARARFEEKKKLLEQNLTKPSVTTDGVSIRLCANIGQFKETDSVFANNADGIGLFRTEFAYLTRRSFPTENELFSAYSTVVKRMGKSEVTIRTIDLGGDKISHLVGGTSSEKNPELGWRAVRMALDRQDIFKTQLRAILRAISSVQDSNAKILFPMISSVTEIRKAKEVLSETAEQLRKEGASISEKIPIGAMIEVPSAAISAEILLREVDFFSIGSNDLIQYTLAVDRTNSRVAHLYQPLNPAVLKLIADVVRISDRNKKRVSICGELAGDTRYTILLLGLGLKELSMNSIFIPRVKEIIRRVSFSNARRDIIPLLDLDTAETIEDALHEINGRYGLRDLDEF